MAFAHDAFQEMPTMVRALNVHLWFGDASLNSLTQARGLSGILYRVTHCSRYAVHRWARHDQ
jgi:hypothetical protein